MRNDHKNLLNRELDGAFLTGEFDQSTLQTAYEIEEEVVLLTAADGNELSISPIANATWVVFPKGCPLRAVTEEWLQREGITSNGKLTL